jgi:hypothetical protein
MSNDYVFVTRWRVEASIEEVSEILHNGSDLARWWPAVYLEAHQLESGNSRGEGNVVALYTKGWLPYTLRWRLRVTESRHPRGFALEASGDLVGRGEWTFTQDGPFADIVYDWRVRADKPLLRYGSLIFKPIFAANHRWAMATGEQSLKLELQRRHARTPAEKSAIPPPPPPTFVRAPHRADLSPRSG